MSKIPQGIAMPNFNKQPSQAGVDLMRPGNGTPWEDRGTSGSIVAYFKTVTKSFTSPGLLVDHIGRPESTRDATALTLVSASMWGIGVLIWNAWWLYFVLPKTTAYQHRPDSEGTYWLTAVGEAALVVGGVYLWMKVGMRLYISLGGAELKGATPSLIQNCFAYSLGPSVLALIPFGLQQTGLLAAPISWFVAAVWIHFNLIVVGKRRLYLKSASAIINVLLIGAGVLVSSLAVYGVFWLWIYKFDAGGLEHIPEKPAPITTVEPRQ